MTDWLTISDIAELTGLKVDTINKYRTRNTLPEPDNVIGRTPTWKRETIETWHALRPTIERSNLD